MKIKFSNAKIKSLARQHAAARKLMLKIERMVDDELDKVIDRISAIEEMRRSTPAHKNELKFLDKYENKLYSVGEQL